MNVDKTKMEALISGYIDGELNENDTKQVEKLLENSAEFKALYGLETELKDFLIKRIRTENAPVQLKTRIKRQINRQNGRPGFIELLSELFEFRPVTSSFALVVVLAIILLPNFSKLKSIDTVEYMQLRGEIVCLDCDIFSKHVDVVAHTDLLHRPGIAGDDGSTWSLIQNQEGEKLDMSLLRKRVELSGIAFNDLRYIKVEGYHLL